MGKSSEGAAGGWSVLIVDDDADDCALFVQSFEAAGVQGLKVARDGAQALALLEDCKEAALPRLVLLDINLPKLRGTEVLRAIKASARLRCVAVVMLTGSAAERDLRECYDAGANGYVVKPAQWEAIQKAVGTIAAFWLGLNRSSPLCGG